MLGVAYCDNKTGDAVFYETRNHTHVGRNNRKPGGSRLEHRKRTGFLA